jgi:hypothetical protein
MLKFAAFVVGVSIASTAHAQSSFTPNQFYGGMMQHQQEILRSYQEQVRPFYNPPIYHDNGFYSKSYGDTPNRHNYSTPCGGYTGIAC